jgi:DNA primase
MLSKERKQSLGLKAERFAGNVGAAAAYLSSRGIGEDVAQAFQLGYVPQGEEFAGRLSIPYLTPTGVVDIKYRCADLTHGDHKGVNCVKYLKESGSGTHLYNARALIGEADMVLLCEGEMDAISIQAYCDYPAVAYPGTQTWKSQEHWKLCFDGVGEVVIIADGDKAGRDAAALVQTSLNSVDFLAARVVDMPDGLDANQFIMQFGAAEFRKKVEQ